jgi:transcriptional regulator with XRE-family HTH domain
MNYDEIHIGKKIQYIFNQSGLTVSQFARMLDLQRTRVYTIFESKTIDIDLLCKISDVLYYDFLSEVYIKKRKASGQSPTTVNIKFQIVTNKLGEFIKPEQKLKKAGIIKKKNKKPEFRIFLSILFSKSSVACLISFSPVIFSNSSI